MVFPEAIVEEALKKIKAHLEEGNWEAAVGVLEALRPPDQAEVLSELPLEQQETLLPIMDAEISADVLEELEAEEAATLASRLKTQDLARILDEMEPDDAADLLGDLPLEKAAEALQAMKEPEEVVPLLRYPDDSAGGRMIPVPITLSSEMTVQEALEKIRLYAPDSDVIYYLFVVDKHSKLVGVVSLRKLITADLNERIENIMDRDVIYVNHFADQEECAKLLYRYELLALPVVDDEGRLLGMVTANEVLDVMAEEATEDIHLMGATGPLREPYLTAKVFPIIRRRFTWLLLLFLAELYTGSVLRHFHSELEKAVALTYFIPLLIGTGGNAGSQSATTVIRAMALGDIKFKDAFKVLLKELSIAVVLGLGIGLAGFLRGLSWGSGLALSITVGLAQLCIILWANTVGSIFPILAARIGLDPAVLSAPFVTTLVDGTGLLIYLLIAKIILGL
jgi:magnesium transporter